MSIFFSTTKIFLILRPMFQFELNPFFKFFVTDPHTSARICIFSKEYSQMMFSLQPLNCFRMGEGLLKIIECDIDKNFFLKHQYTLLAPRASHCSCLKSSFLIPSTYNSNWWKLYIIQPNPVSSGKNFSEQSSLRSFDIIVSVVAVVSYLLRTQQIKGAKKKV